MTAVIEHDPLVCGIASATDCPACRPRFMALRRLEALTQRLRKLDINMEDFAELLLVFTEPYLEAKIAKIADALIRRKLQRLYFTWRLDDDGVCFGNGSAGR